MRCICQKSVESCTLCNRAAATRTVGCCLALLACCKYKFFLSANDLQPHKSKLSMPISVAVQNGMLAVCCVCCFALLAGRLTGAVKRHCLV